MPLNMPGTYTASSKTSTSFASQSSWPVPSIILTAEAFPFAITTTSTRTDPLNRFLTDLGQSGEMMRGGMSGDSITWFVDFGPPAGVVDSDDSPSAPGCPAIGVSGGVSAVS